MHRVVLVLAVCAAFLSACATESSPAWRPAQPAGKPVFITLQVERHLNKYYSTVGAGRSGAFAVSEKGHVGFYAYCQAFSCRDEVSFTREALRGCEVRAHSPCVILAVGRTVRHRYMTYRQAEAEGLL
ncbi:hypothetical protein [Dongia deserti]|uniref:hypothetical protein n=1 Tax=Dongia deserti TaxID=2268030 RepID=UPI000E649BBD|nr:hypothetical protein [Dongia deserti]